jgi:hypothetical protein
MSFAEFVNCITCIPDRLKDQHFRPQYLFLEPYEGIGIHVKVFRLEERLQLKSFLNDQRMELTHRNKSEDAYDYAQYYNVKLVQQVYNIYQTDIDKYGYKESYKALQKLFNK